MIELTIQEVAEYLRGVAPKMECWGGTCFYTYRSSEPLGPIQQYQFPFVTEKYRKDVIAVRCGGRNRNSGDRFWDVVLVVSKDESGKFHHEVLEHAGRHGRTAFPRYYRLVGIEIKEGVPTVTVQGGSTFAFMVLPDDQPTHIEARRLRVPAIP